MKPGLSLAVVPGATDRTGNAGKATMRPAVHTLIMKVTTARLDIKTGPCKSPYRTGCKTGLVGAAIAGTRHTNMIQRQALCDMKGRTKGVPKPKLRMNRQAQWRLMKIGAAQGPTCEG